MHFVFALFEVSCRDNFLKKKVASVLGFWVLVFFLSDLHACRVMHLNRMFHVASQYRGSGNMALVDSEAAFSQHCSSIGAPSSVVTALKNANIITFAGL